MSGLALLIPFEFNLSPDKLLRLNLSKFFLIKKKLMPSAPHPLPNSFHLDFTGTDFVTKYYAA